MQQSQKKETSEAQDNRDIPEAEGQLEQNVKSTVVNNRGAKTLKLEEWLQETY